MKLGPWPVLNEESSGDGWTSMERKELHSKSSINDDNDDGEGG